MPHLDALHKAPRPIIGINDAIVVLLQEWQKYLAGGEGVGNVVPVTHEQVQELIKLLQIFEVEVGVARFETTDLRQVLAGQDDLRTADQGGKETVQLLQIHGAFAIRSEQQFL